MLPKNGEVYFYNVFNTKKKMYLATSFGDGLKFGSVSIHYWL